MENWQKMVEKRNSVLMGSTNRITDIMKLYDKQHYHRRKGEIILGCSAGGLREIENPNSPMVWRICSAYGKGYAKKTIWFSRHSRSK